MATEWNMTDSEQSTTVVLNETEIDTMSVAEALSGPHPEVAQMIRWSVTTQGDTGSGRGRVGSMFQRDRYVTPERLFDQFRMAYDAVDSDDVVGGVADTSEALAFNRMSFTALDEDEENIWNQILFDLDLEDRVREMWRELFICTDEATEILTERGWLTHDQLVPGEDRVLCLDPDTSAITWQTLQRVNRFDFHGEMYQWRTERFDALTTGDHRWLTESRGGRRSLKTTAEIDAAKTAHLVLSGGEPCAFAAQPSFSDELVELIGWVITEGHFQTHDRFGVNGVIVTQSRKVNPDYCDRIARLVKYFCDQGATAREFRYGDAASSFYFGKGVAEIIRALAPEKQITPAFLTLLTLSQAQLLYDTVMAADGHVQTRGGYSERWAQKDSGRVDGFQMLTAMLGRRTRVATGSRCSTVAVYKNALAQSKQFRTEMVRHDGLVWCPTTSTGTWMARRNGTTYWTGNCSQLYAVTWWGTRSYKVRGTSDQGVKRKKTYENLTVPLGISLLDPTKVVPVGNLMFNQEQLAYIADRTEIDMLDAAVLNDPTADPISRQIILGKYAPLDMERRRLTREGINADWLYLMNPKYVWRHTLTHSQYERFANVRMKGCFEILDLKHQLRQMDRAHLIGGTNFIILIRKGTDHLPAKPEEINQLRGQVTMVSQMPILVGDHRLAVEIVTPKQDMSLSTDKYSVLDARLTTRLWGMFLVHGGSGQPRSDDSVKLAMAISRSLEARRQGLRRRLERQVVVPTVLANPGLETVPSLRFHPSRIELNFDPATQTFIQDARDRGDLSRDSYLAELDFDQEWEAVKREREKRDYDDIFTMTNVPFSAPGPGHAVPVGPGGKPNEEPEGTATNAPAAPVPPHSHAPDGTPVALPAAPTPAGTTKSAKRSAGRNLGGNRSGGGAAPGTGQGKPPATGVPKK